MLFLYRIMENILYVYNPYAVHFTFAGANSLFIAGVV